MPEPYGASQEAWHHWSVTLQLTEHLLPVVANPGAKISPDSKIQMLGKTPTRYNFRGEVSGFAKWTEHRTTSREVGQYQLVSDYGICVQARLGSLRGIDLDLEDPRKSAAIVRTIEAALPLHNFMYRRTREGTGKLLLPFRFEEPMPKAILEVEGGIIELLGDGQQWIAESSYLVQDTRNKTNSLQKVKGRYLWPNGWPPSKDAVPLFTRSDLDALREALEMVHGTKGWSDARLKRDPRDLVVTGARPGGDPVANYIEEKWDVREYGRGGEIFIRCPFDNEHTSDSGPTETVYYSAGTGGYERGHFKCLHSHCLDRTDDDYLQAIGYSNDLSDAPGLTDDGGDEQRVLGSPLRYMIDKQGRKENRIYNHLLFLASKECGKRIAYDEFSAQIVWCRPSDKPGEERWKLWGDEHYADVVMQMDRNGFVPQQAITVRSAVHKVAMDNRVDLAIEWARRLPEWDGVPRVEGFLVEYMAAEDTPYTRAVGLYIWTALAGRVLDPGCQADMVPILVSEQGERKTSAIRALAPTAAWFGEINLSERDENTSRKMRGKVVIELDELRGLKSRAVEDIKSFITRREEEWVPKYQEFARTFKRRFIMFGSTNRDDFLGDPTGERRYLPVHVGGGSQLRVEEIEHDRDQLWAEGVARWGIQGVVWEDAEALARFEHGRFKDHDDWTEVVRKWVLADDPLAGGRPADREFTGAEVLVGCGLKRAGEIEDKHSMRVGKVLKGLGFKNTYTRRGRVYRLVDEGKLA